MYFVNCYIYLVFSFCFFFQAEDGIRDGHVTGVQTCALPISQESPHRPRGRAVQSQGGAGQSVASPDPPEEGAEIGVIAVPGGPLRAEDATRSPVGRAADRKSVV